MTYRPNIERGKRVLCFYEKPEVAYRAAADSTALMPDVLRRAGTKPAALRAVAYFAFTAAAYSADAADIALYVAAIKPTRANVNYAKATAHAAHAAAALTTGYENAAAATKEEKSK